MIGVRTEIEIDADPDTVWNVLTDFAAYPEWNPLLPAVEARLVPGAPVDMRARIGARTVKLDATMMTIRPGAELRWRGPRSRLLAPLVRAEHWFVLERGGAGGQVLFRHGEDFSGVLVPLVQGWIVRTLRPAHVAFNEALRRRAEARRRTTP